MFKSCSAVKLGSEVSSLNDNVGVIMLKDGIEVFNCLKQFHLSPVFNKCT